MHKYNLIFIVFISLIFGSCCALCVKKSQAKPDMKSPIKLSSLGKPISVDTLTIVDPNTYYEEAWVLNYYRSKGKSHTFDTIYDGTQLIQVIGRDRSNQVVSVKSILFQQKHYEFD
jgi:hypothetical protein